jgi:hypothetical protein
VFATVRVGTAALGCPSQAQLGRIDATPGGPVALGIGDLLVRSFLCGLLKSLILEFDLGGAAVHRCDDSLVFSASFTACRKTLVSYQGIALAMP